MGRFPREVALVFCGLAVARCLIFGGMINEQAGGERQLKALSMSAELVIVGGGIAGVCAAITAAREGVEVVLVQDRPVLGGNASSEVRLWMLGATSHMGNNNRWSREGGVIDELLVENTYRNREGNPVLFDMILLDKVVSEPNITLLLNTAVHELEREGDRIVSVTGFCSQNSTRYTLTAPLFIDASGDGILGFLSGAAFRMGAEPVEEFGELFAPTAAYGELLGHTLYFYSKDTGVPVKYTAPSFALRDITSIPRYKSFNAKEFGCKLWWVEYGGRLDTVHDTEAIKWELWKVIYGTWDHIKNSGEFPEAENLTLEWAGTIPGKRESRRFEGDYMLRQQDIVEQRLFSDAVGFGGWSIDLHPADGVFSEKPGCNQWHSKGIYQVPYRCLYSRNISNLFLAGRIISATHVAFGSTRVMATCGYLAQAVAVAAKICLERDMLPAQVYSGGHVSDLQQRLMRLGQHIPGLSLLDPGDLAHFARISASSTLLLSELPAGKKLLQLNMGTAQLLPLAAGEVPSFVLHAKALRSTSLRLRLMGSEKPGNFTPELRLCELTMELVPGYNRLEVDFPVEVARAGYYFLVLEENPLVSVHCSDMRLTGILSAFNTVNRAVSNFGRQTPPEDIGVEGFEFWCPARRPGGENLAMEISPALECFSVANLRSGVERPVDGPNAWVASPSDESPQLVLEWDSPVNISRIELMLDPDYDHPMESVLMGHPEEVMPFCVRDYSIFDGDGNLLFERHGNYQGRNVIQLDAPVTLSRLVLRLSHPSAQVPASVFALRCYS